MNVPSDIMIGKLYTASTHLCLYTDWNGSATSTSRRMRFRGETMPSNELFMVLGISLADHNTTEQIVVEVLLASGEKRALLVYPRDLVYFEKQPTDV